MASKSRHPEPKIVRPDDVDPAHRWDRPLQAPGRTQVDFEERVDFRRLHGYRLARVRAALANSGLGALLRSEEHTSELQSRFDLVCRLLLEKKKKNITTLFTIKITSLYYPS